MKIKKIKRKKVYKTLFLMLMLCSHLSVDRSLQAFIYVVYREIKVCVHVALGGWDKWFEPVD